MCKRRANLIEASRDLLEWIEKNIRKMQNHYTNIEYNHPKL